MQDKEASTETFDIPPSQYDVATLTDFYAKSKEGSQRILPKEKRRYVMYLRKSTDDEAKQVRSLEDQETECRTVKVPLSATPCLFLMREFKCSGVSCWAHSERCVDSFMVVVVNR